MKYKLKDYNMMKNFMTSGALSKGREPEGNPGGKDATPIPREAMIMTTFG
jgi:hypothetical protein